MAQLSKDFVGVCRVNSYEIEVEISLAMSVIFSYPLKLALVWDSPQQAYIYSSDTCIPASCQALPVEREWHLLDITHPILVQISQTSRVNQNMYSK